MSKAKEAVELVSDGYSYAEAAEAVGTNWNWVKRSCDARGVTQSAKAAARAEAKSRNAGGPYRTRRPDTAALVCKLVAGGMTYGEVAAQLNISRLRVAGYVYRARQKVNA
jgi:DNA-binding NarL/FixJ family response regulator